MVQKRRLVLVFFSIFFLIASFFSVGIYAQETEEQTANVLSDITDEPEIIFADSGMNPSSPFYFADRFFEGIGVAFAGSPEKKAELETKYLEERYSEMNNMVMDGNYNAVQKASSEAGKIFQNMETHIHSFDVTETNMERLKEDGSSFDNLVTAHYGIMRDMEYANYIEKALMKKAEQGEIENEIVDDIIGEIKDSKAGLEKEISEKKEEYVVAVAQTEGITKLEVKLAVDDIEKEQGLNALYREDLVYDNFEEVYNDIGKLEQKAEELKTQGETEKAETIEAIIENADLMIQDSYFAFDNVDYDTAYVNYNDARDYISTGKDAIVKGDYSYMINNMIPVPSEKIAEHKKESEDFKVEWEIFKTEITEKYPEKASAIAVYFNKRELQEEKATEVAEKLEEVYNVKLEELKADGKSEKEANAILSKDFNEEFARAYGKEYTPPGFFKQEEIQGEAIGNRQFNGRVDWDSETGRIIDGWNDQGLVEGGGFVQSYKYENPTDGYSYSFGKDGYSYTTPYGMQYGVSYPIGYNPETYDRGDEVFTYENDDGSKWIYSATGVVVEEQDGTKEDFLYDAQDKYVVVGGGLIDNEATGYVYQADDGVATVYEYSPEFENYMDIASGKVFVPPTSPYKEKMMYKGNEKTYEYSYEGSTWQYSPEKSQWVSSTGEVKTTRISPAPIGYENSKEYTTPHGEKWNYNSEKAMWQSSNGEKYYPSPNQYYTYDSKGEKYIDYSGKVYEAGSENYGKYTDPAGAQWNYAGSGVWGSGEKIYNSMTGEVRGVKGEEMKDAYYGKYYDSKGTETYSGGFVDGHYTLNPDGRGYGYYETNYYNPANKEKYTDPNGQAWERNEKGVWANTNANGVKPSDYFYGTYNYKTEFNYQGPAYGSMHADFAEVGRTVTVGSQTYKVTAEKGWTDSSGKAVPPPTGQPSSAVGEYYFGVYAPGGYTADGTYTPPSGSYVGAGSGIYGGTQGASVGTTAVYNGQTYTVTADKGWTDSSGKVVATPPGQPSYYAGESYSGPGYTSAYGGGMTYESTYSGKSYDYGGAVYGGTPSGSYTGGYDSSGAYVGVYGGGTGSSAYGGGAYDSSGNYVGGVGGAMPSYSPPSGAYDSSGNPTGSYSGGTPSGGAYSYSSGTLSSGYSGGSYSGEYSGGTYSGGTSGTGTYSGGSYSGGYTGGSAPSGGDSGSYSGGGSYSGSGDSGGMSGGGSSGGGDSGGSTGGDSGGGSGDSGGSSGGDSGGGGGTGMVVSKSGTSANGNWFWNIFKNIFG